MPGRSYPVEWALKSTILFGLPDHPAEPPEIQLYMLSNLKTSIDQGGQMSLMAQVVSTSGLASHKGHQNLKFVHLKIKY